MPTITGKIHDQLGVPSTAVDVKIRPANAAHVITRDDGGVELGAHPWSGTSVPDPITLEAGVWVVVVSTTQRANRELLFPPQSFTIDLTTVTTISWAEIYEGVAAFQPVTPSQVVEAQDAADAAALSATDAEAAATRAEAVGDTNDTIMAGVLNDPASASRGVADATYAARTDAPDMADQAVGLARVADAFTLTAGGVALSRTGDDYRLWHGLGGGLYARYLLEAQGAANPGAYPLHQLAGLDTVKTMLEAAHTAATKVGTWSTGTNAGAIGGAYAWSATTGDTYTYTTPSDVTAVMLGAPLVTNGGRLSKVDLDGDMEAADWLPSAQQVVDLGWYANTILTTNGGTLNPKQRVLDSYAPTVATTDWTNRPMLAANLPPAAHTVKLTVTEYARIGKTVTERTYVSGVGYATASTTPATASVVQSTDKVLSDLNSAWEYAHKVKPAGATAYGEMGQVHGYDEQTSITFTVDGVASTPTDGQTVVGSKRIIVTRVSKLHHLEAGHVANVTTVYTLDRRGLRVDVDTTWLTGGDVAWSWIMLPVNGSLPAAGQKFEMGTVMDYAAGPLLLSGTNGDQYLGRVPSPAAWLWSQQNLWAVAALVPDTTSYLNRWDNSSPAYAQINDRNGSVSKIYFARVSTEKLGHIAAGDVWRSSVRYLTAPFAGDRKALLRKL